MKSICRRVFRLVVFILKISIIVCQNNTICGNIACSPNARGCSMDGNTCRCLAGFMGIGCEEDIDECKRAHVPLCGNTGICENIPGRFICKCLPGWYGVHCKNRNQTVVAECLPGWTGTACDKDIDECQHATDKKEELCQNSGTCVNNAGSYTCSCMAGWQGLDCSIDINECEMAQPCGDLSTCLNTPGSFSCICASGWQGDKCIVDVNECLSSPCGNFGNCSNTVGSYLCLCSPSWTGTLCDVLKKAQPDIATNTGLIVGMILGSLLFLWGIIVVLVLMKYSLRKSRKITERGNDVEMHGKASNDASDVTPTTPAMAPQCPRGLQEIVMKTTVAINKVSP